LDRRGRWALKIQEYLSNEEDDYQGQYESKTTKKSSLLVVATRLQWKSQTVDLHQSPISAPGGHGLWNGPSRGAKNRKHNWKKVGGTKLMKRGGVTPTRRCRGKKELPALRRNQAERHPVIGHEGGERDGEPRKVVEGSPQPATQCRNALLERVSGRCTRTDHHCLS